MRLEQDLAKAQDMRTKGPVTMSAFEGRACGGPQLCPWSREGSHRQHGMKLSHHLTFPLTSLKNVKTALCLVGQTETGGGPHRSRRPKSADH